MIKNNKGFLSGLEPGAVQMIFWGLAFILSTYSLTVGRPPHIEKSAINKCIELNGVPATCYQMIKTWDIDKQVDYIRDDDMSTGNQGNFVNGYML